MSSAATIETTRTRTKGPKLTIVQGSSQTISSHSSKRAPKIMASLPNIMVMFAVLGFGIMVYCANSVIKTQQLRSRVHASYKGSSGDLVTPPLIPRSAVIQNVEVFFLLPTATSTTRGVLLFFHGCNHAGGQDFFELPEDRIVALAALNRGLAVLAPTSINRNTGCWGPADAHHLQEVVEKWMASVGLHATIPKMGMGASSGGAILFTVHQSLGLSSIAPYVSGRGFTESQLASGNVPPTIFVHMTKDTHTAEQVEQSHQAILKAGVASEMVAVHPLGLTPELCSKRLPEFGDRRCQAFLRDVVAQGGLVDKTDYTVLKSYQGGDWKSVMEKHKLNAGLKQGDMKIKGVASPTSFGGHSWLWASMEEEIAASFGLHEMTAQHRQQVLDFLMKHAGIQLDKSSKM